MAAFSAAGSTSWALPNYYLNTGALVMGGKKASVDGIDIQIIQCLTDNGRLSASQIGKQINLSVSAVSERIRKLEQSGLIKGYTAIIDEESAGYGTKAIISIRLENAKFNDTFSQKMRAHPNVVECFYITGGYDYIARVVTPSVTELTQVLNDIKDIPGVSYTHTYVVLEDVKQGGSVCPQI